MSGKTLMLTPDDVGARARIAYGRNWRDWAHARALVMAAPSESEASEPPDGPTGKLSAAAAPELAMSLHPPREADLATPELRVQARDWVEAWQECALPGKVEWRERHWARVGNQRIPVRAVLSGPEDIACWAGKEREWGLACSRVRDVTALLEDGRGFGPGACLAAPSARGLTAQAWAGAVRSSIAGWCALDDADWQRALGVLTWLLAHPGAQCYVRQLPIRGVDTKWMERHGAAVRPLYRALAGVDFAFTQPRRQFRCKACSPSVAFAGCREFALDARGLNALAVQDGDYPFANLRAALICENLVNTLCLDALEGVLAIHGGGFAVADLREVGWLRDVPLYYWGDLDSNGFAILNVVRGFAPHARSLMMDVRTLERHRDLCVEEPKPAFGPFERLTPEEQAAFGVLHAGDPMLSLANLRLEQERIEWGWVTQELSAAFG